MSAFEDHTQDNAQEREIYRRCTYTRYTLDTNARTEIDDRARHARLCARTTDTATRAYRHGYQSVEESTASSNTYMRSGALHDEVREIDPPDLPPHCDAAEAPPLLKGIQRVAFEDDHTVTS